VKGCSFQQRRGGERGKGNPPGRTMDSEPSDRIEESLKTSNLVLTARTRVTEKGREKNSKS